MPKRRWRPILVLCGGAIGICTAQLKVRKCKMYGSWPKTSWSGEWVCRAMGRILINAAACKTTWPHAEEPSLVHKSSVRAIICTRLIMDSANPFWVWTCETGCSTSIPKEAQYASKLLDVNSSTLSILMLFMEYSGKCVWSFMIYASKCAKETLRVDNKQTWDHLQDASTNTIKYLNGPLAGCIGPQISP